MTGVQTCALPICGGMGSGSHQGMGMMTMFASSLLRSGNLGDMFPPRTARGLAM